MALREPRWYIGLSALKNELGVTATTHDAKLKRYIARASSFCESETGRVFIPVTATRKFDVPDLPRGALYLNDDLLSVTSITDDGGAKAASDYFLYPANKTPKGRVELLGTDEQWTWTDSRQQAISIAGDWGYCNDYEATGATLGAALASTTATTFTASDGALLEVGWTLLVDTERLFVSGISSNTVTVQRGVGGSTAATHLISSAIYRYVPPGDIEEAVMMIASVWHAWREAGGVASETIGNYSVSYVNGWPLPDLAVQTLARYKRLTFR